MIEYWKGPYSLNLLFQLDGSTLYGSFLPGCISCVIYYIFYFHKLNAPEPTPLSLVSATIISLLITSVSFVIVYRVKFCYDRYFEACRDVHIMMSKWSDATASAACFHMQSLHAMKPPAICKHPHLFDPCVYTDRQVINVDCVTDDVLTRHDNDFGNTSSSSSSCSTVSLFEDNNWIIKKEGMLDGGWCLLNDDEDDNITEAPSDPDIKIDKTAHLCATRKPPSLFLQELMHLSSLCVAVAFNTFRDFDGDNYEHYNSSSFGTYNIDKPTWPETNPYHLDNHAKYKNKTSNIIMRYIRYFFGLSRSTNARLRYSMGRSLDVLGGISKNEMIALSRARGNLFFICFNSGLTKC